MTSLRSDGDFVERAELTSLRSVFIPAGVEGVIAAFFGRTSADPDFDFAD